MGLELNTNPATNIQFRHSGRDENRTDSSDTAVTLLKPPEWVGFAVRDATTGECFRSPGASGNSLDCAALFDSHLPRDDANTIVDVLRYEHGLPIGKILLSVPLADIADRLHSVGKRLQQDDYVFFVCTTVGGAHASAILLAKPKRTKETLCLLIDALGAGRLNEEWRLALSGAFHTRLYITPTTQHTGTGCLANALHPIEYAQESGFIESLLNDLERAVVDDTRCMSIEDFQSCPEYLIPLQDKWPVSTEMANKTLRYGPYRGMTLKEVWRLNSPRGFNGYATTRARLLKDAERLARGNGNLIKPETQRELDRIFPSLMTVAARRAESQSTCLIM